MWVRRHAACLRVCACGLADVAGLGAWQGDGCPLALPWLRCAGGGSPNRLLSGAADRFKAVRQLITGQAPGAAGPSATHLAEDSGAGYGAAPSAEAGAGGGEQQLGQKLKSGFRSLLGKSGGREAAAAGQGAEGEGRHLLECSPGILHACGSLALHYFVCSSAHQPICAPTPRRRPCFGAPSACRRARA